MPVFNSCTSCLRPNNLHPSKPQRFSPVFPQATWKNLDICILLSDSQPIERILHQPTLVKRLRQLLHLTYMARLTRASCESSFSPNEHMHVPDNRLLPGIFQDPFIRSLNCQYRISNVTNRQTPTDTMSSIAKSSENSLNNSQASPVTLLVSPQIP